MGCKVPMADSRSIHCLIRSSVGVIVCSISVRADAHGYGWLHARQFQFAWSGS